MLPCNVILYENNEVTTVSIIKPTIAMNVIENAQLQGIAETIENKLRNVIASI